MKILIVRTSAIGDIFLTLPIAERLKTAFPESEISWVVEAQNANMLKGNPYIDKIYLFHRNKKEGIRGLISATLKIKEEFEGKYFDYVIDCQGRLKNLGILKSLEYGKLIGYLPCEEPLSLFYNHKLRLKSEDTYIKKNNLVAEFFDIECKNNIYPYIELSNENKAFATQFIENNNLKRKKIAIIFATSKECKYWEKEKWIELINRFDTDYNSDAILMGAKSDMAYAREILSSCKNAYSVVGNTSLHEAMSVLEICDGAVAVDTALMHFSVIIGIPTVCLFGAEIHKTFHIEKENFIVAHKPSKKNSCQRTCSCKNATCMKNISVDDVFKKLDSFF